MWDDKNNIQFLLVTFVLVTFVLVTAEMELEYINTDRIKISVISTR